MVVVSNIIIKFFEFVFRSKIRAIAIFPFIFISSQTKMNKVLLNHEKIHLRQQLELLIIPFYIWYLIENIFKDYENISFEREAFVKEKDLDYLKKRKLFQFVKYIFPKLKKNN